MPNWNFVPDLYNTTFDRKQCNPFGLTEITQEVYDQYVVYEQCLVCKAWLEEIQPKPNCYKSKECMLRPFDYSSGIRNIVTKGLGRPPSLMILIGTLVWNFHHKLGFIFRACAENGIEMHHKNRNPYDNRFQNIVMIDTHSKLHGQLSMVETTIKNLTLIAANTKYNKKIHNEIKRQEKLYLSLTDGVTDCPKVFQIADVVNQVLKGIITCEEGQLKLEEINAAFPIKVIENKEQYDFRKLRNQHEHIKNFEEIQDAVQDVPLLVI